MQVSLMLYILINQFDPILGCTIITFGHKLITSCSSIFNFNIFF